MEMKDILYGILWAILLIPAAAILMIIWFNILLYFYSVIEYKIQEFEWFLRDFVKRKKKENRNG